MVRSGSWVPFVVASPVPEGAPDGPRHVNEQRMRVRGAIRKEPVAPAGKFGLRSGRMKRLRRDQSSAEYLNG
jgi:hypothetical protein